MRRTLLAATAIVLLTAGCGGSDDKGSDVPTATAPPTDAPTASATSAPTPEPTQGTTTAPASTLIDYGEDGVTVAKPADVARLTGAPEDFTAFLVADLRRQQDAKDDVCTEKPQIQVSRIDTRGWAAGGSFIPQCGGSATLWAKVGGDWREVWGGQTLPECKVLEKFAFPAGVAGGECGTDDGRTRTYP